MMRRLTICCLMVCFCLSGAMAQKKIGALVFDKSEIEQLMKEAPNLAGVIFKIKDEDSIEVEVLGLEWEKDNDFQNFSTPLIDLSPKEVISFSTRERSKKFEEFQYDFKQELVESNFSLAFVTRDQLEILFQVADSEIALSGTTFSYGARGDSPMEYFTFKLEAMETVDLLASRNSIGLPGFIILTSCPPFWVSDGSTDETKEKKVVLTCSYSVQKESVELTWAVKGAGKINEFQIHRATEGESFSLLKTIGKKECKQGGYSSCQFIDKDVEKDQIYKYKIKVQRGNDPVRDFSKVGVVFSGQ